MHCCHRFEFIISLVVSSFESIVSFSQTLTDFFATRLLSILVFHTVFILVLIDRCSETTPASECAREQEESS